MRTVEPIQITDAIMLDTNVPEADRPAYIPATTYIKGFEVMTAGHWIFRSLQAGNMGHNPLDEPLDITQAVWWLRVRKTNRWLPFDKITDTQATQEDSMYYKLAMPGRADSIVLLNVFAGELHIKQTDAIFGVVYDKTFSLIDLSGINDYYPYFFSPTELQVDFETTELPNYANTTIEITLSQPGGTVGVGEIIVGKKRQVGLTKDEPSVALNDFSIKKVNQFGDAELKPGASTRDMDLQLTVAKAEVSKTMTYLDSRRGKETVFIGTEKHSITIVYGWPESIKQSISRGDYSVITGKIKGLR